MADIHLNIMYSSVTVCIEWCRLSILCGSVWSPLLGLVFNSMSEGLGSHTEFARNCSGNFRDYGVRGSCVRLLVNRGDINLTENARC
jgi:hypothetical protein